MVYVHFFHVLVLKTHFHPSLVSYSPLLPQSSTLAVVSPKPDHSESVLSKEDRENMEKSLFFGSQDWENNQSG